MILPRFRVAETRGPRPRATLTPSHRVIFGYGESREGGLEIFEFDGETIMIADIDELAEADPSCFGNRKMIFLGFADTDAVWQLTADS